MHWLTEDGLRQRGNEGGDTGGHAGPERNVARSDGGGDTSTGSDGPEGRARPGIARHGNGVTTRLTYAVRGEQSVRLAE